MSSPPVGGPKSDHGTDHAPPLGETVHAPITSVPVAAQKGWSGDHGTDHGDHGADRSRFPPPLYRGGNVRPGVIDTSEWGPWRLYPPTLVLVLVATGQRRDGSRFDYERYEVDLERCLTSAEVLDWICQVAGKTYADDVLLAGLVRALDDVLAPQAHLCSCGTSKKLTRRTVARRVAQAAKRWPQHVHVRTE